MDFMGELGTGRSAGNRNSWWGEGGEIMPREGMLGKTELREPLRDDVESYCSGNFVKSMKT